MRFSARRSNSIKRLCGTLFPSILSRCAELTRFGALHIPKLIDSAAIAFANAASKAGVQCDLEPIIESEIEHDLFDYRAKR